MNTENKDALFFNNVSDFVNWVEAQKRFSKKVSLENMKYFSSLFDYPEQKFKSIHVTGTNGKGSTVSYLKNIYLKAGYHVATFTSPYVISFNERITYNDKFISDKDLLKYGNLILSKYPQILNDGNELPSFFEFITLLAFLYFASIENLDLAIIEVGIGGRLDATNIITPLLSIITNVSYDHMEQLGSTLELITNEKLGIVKESIPLVTSCKNPLLIDIMEKKCHELKSNFIKVDFERLKIKKMSLDQFVFSYKDYDNVCIKMLGSHQVENASLAIEVVETCNNFWKNKKSNLYVSKEILYEGIISTTWPGRLECVSKKPLIYVDGGHNIDCIQRISEFVSTLPFINKRVVIAISNDKDKEKMINILDHTFTEIIFTHYTYQRSATALDLYKHSHADNKIIIDQIDDAIQDCFDHPSEFTLFVGSLYLVSEIRPKFLNNQKN